MSLLPPRALAWPCVVLLATAPFLTLACRTTHCAVSTDCPTAEFCVFPIGNCAAAGECVSPSATEPCDTAQVLCGCDGRIVQTGCGYTVGYASGPTTGGTLTTVDPLDASVACTPGDGGS